MLSSPILMLDSSNIISVNVGLVMQFIFENIINCINIVIDSIYLVPNYLKVNAWFYT